jgi:hypothetical protein
MGQKEHSYAIHQKMAEIKRLRREQIKLTDELEVSLALQELWPEVFNHGSCKVRFEGGRIAHRMVLVQGNGEEKAFQLEDVPTILWYKDLMKLHAQSSMSGWPKALREEYMRRKRAGEGRGRRRTRLEDR